MSARRLGILLGAVVALFIALSGGGASVLAPARADDPTTEPTLASTLPPTTQPPATQPPATDPPATQPDITPDTAPPSTAAGNHRTTTTSRHGTATTISSETTEVVAGVTDTTLSPETTVTPPSSTTPRTAARVALPSTHDDNSSNTGKLLALLLGGFGLSAVAFAGVRANTRRRRTPYESNYVAPMVLPPLFGQPEAEAAPQVDWAPLWDPSAGEATTAVTPAVPVESARARRKRERRERFHEEHDHVDPDEALAALAASTPLAAPQVDWSSEPEPEPEPEPELEPEPEPEPAPEPPRQVADPYEDLDLSAPADLDPSIPDMHIDLSDPEL
jgi:hypothetical protein